MKSGSAPGLGIHITHYNQSQSGLSDTSLTRRDKTGSEEVPPDLHKWTQRANAKLSVLRMRLTRRWKDEPCFGPSVSVYVVRYQFTEMMALVTRLARVVNFN